MESVDRRNAHEHSTFINPFSSAFWSKYIIELMLELFKFHPTNSLLTIDVTLVRLIYLIMIFHRHYPANNFCKCLKQTLEISRFICRLLNLKFFACLHKLNSVWGND